MDFFKAVSDLDKSKDNIAITIVSGSNINSKILLSDGEIIYNNNENVNWEPIINAVPQNRKSGLITFGGEKIYIEFTGQKCRTVVCGAGHISISIIKMCKLMELPVTVIDDRIKFINDAVKAGADNVICDSFDNALEKVSGDDGTFFIIVTRGHRYDQICLEKIIEKENAYIGMIGSRVRVKKVLDYLEENGVSRSKIDKVYTPIGLDIGAETPAEISVSIMAQIIEVKNRRINSGTYTDELLKGLADEKNSAVPKALVTIVSRKGSAPREISTKMAVLKDGTMIGTIGGGCVEADIRRIAFSCIENNECRLVKVDMTGREAEDEGMVCGGIIELYVEPLP